MFWTSLKKVCGKIEAIEMELVTLGHRIAEHEERFEMAKKLGLARTGEDEEIQLWRRVQTQLSKSLPLAKDKIKSGEEDFRQINRILPMTKQQLAELRSVLDATDRAVAGAQAAARKGLGSR